ncbi:hypothetical protein [Pseudomonas chlororaphis]
MSRLALILALLSTGASADPLPYGVSVFHDDARGVTCWLYRGSGNWSGLSCIPDSQLSADSKRQLSPHEQEDGPTPAVGAPAWNDERYSM